MNKQYPLQGVALGPGDPELITVKALRALENADVIYYACSRIDALGEQSFSKKILDHYQLAAPCRALLFPMTGKDRTRFYTEAYETLKSAVHSGQRVCFVTEGDACFYSTFGYLLKMATAENLPVEVLSGVPAFIAAGALGVTPIVEENKSLTVLARPTNFDELTARLSTNDAVVVMKMKVIKGWFEYLSTCERNFVYCEYVGTEKQFISTNIDDLKGREIPYFSLILFPGIEINNNKSEI